MTSARLRPLLFAIPPLILVLTGVICFVYLWQREDARRAICGEWIVETTAAIDSASRKLTPSQVLKHVEMRKT